MSILTILLILILIGVLLPAFRPVTGSAAQLLVGVLVVLLILAILGTPLRWW